LTFISLISASNDDKFWNNASDAVTQHPYYVTKYEIKKKNILAFRMVILSPTKQFKAINV
jgi:hypothetical protein